MGTMSSCEKFVGLVRVSTEEQGRSGLGLEAGVHDLRTYCDGVGGELITIVQEIGSGCHDDLIDRPYLLKALTLCKRRRACLLVPKVDRLVRSTEVHSDIKRSGVSFRACDNPTANEFTLDILVAVAANEARAISDRTRRALAAYKARGGLLGSHLVGCHLTDTDRARGSAKANARSVRLAVDVYSDLAPDIVAWHHEGLSLRGIAARLNEAGHRTRTDVPFGPVQVKRILDRALTSV